MTKQAKFEKPRGLMPVLQICTPDQLTVDPSYQRSIENIASMTLIKRIAVNWDWSLCQPLVVSRRDDGQLYVLDGQHRLEAARMRGDISMIPCVIVNCANREDEARTFSEFNTRRKPLTSLEIFRADYAAGDPTAVVIMHRLSLHGLKLAKGTNNQDRRTGEIGNIGGLKACLKTHGEEVLDAALFLTAEAFRGQVLQYIGTIFPGIAEIARHEVRRWKGKGSATPWTESHRCGMVIDLLKGRTQDQWFRDVYFAKAQEPGTNLSVVTGSMFLDLWCSKADA